MEFLLVQLVFWESKTMFVIRSKPALLTHKACQGAFVCLNSSLTVCTVCVTICMKMKCTHTPFIYKYTYGKMTGTVYVKLLT